MGAIFYNGIPTMQKKTDLAYQKGGGIMIREISQDVTGANSLLGANHNMTGLPAGVYAISLDGNYASASRLILSAP